MIADIPGSNRMNPNTFGYPKVKNVLTKKL